MAGDAGAGTGAGRLNPPGDDGRDVCEVDAVAVEPVGEADVPAPVPPRPPSKLTGRWIAAAAVTLALLAAGLGVGGYLAMRSGSASAATAAADTAAMDAARVCVAATHAPDVSAMSAAQAKIIDCSTGDFAVQANFYSGVIVDAYQAAQVQMQMSEMHSAVEKHNDDGSINVLVAFRVRMSNAEVANQEIGYRLRATMALDGDQYKVAKLDTVSS